MKKIESHPHRPTLQADLYNPFCEKSKKMIRDMGNVELFELCETIPKVQCSYCLLYWDQEIVYCICGHLLRENESSRHFHQWRLDIHSIPNYVIKKVRLHGARHGKTEAELEQLLPVYLPYWMCVQSSFYHQLWINTWRSKFEQETDSVLSACGS